MTFQILIATMHEKFFKNNIAIPADYLVINQYQETKPNLISKHNLFSFKEKGLSRSRNHALELTQADIVLISDDDIHYLSSVEETITTAFKTHPEADIITFQIETPEGTPFRNYAAKPFWHTKKSILSVCSVEIAMRIQSIHNKDLRFDEQFGLGTNFPSGEENIFLTDALKKGLKILFIPHPIVIHPQGSSGSSYDILAVTQAKGALFYRIFGILAYPISIVFSYKKYPHSSHTFWEFIKIMFEGIKHYRSIK